MVAGGNALEAFAEGRARRELTALLARAPAHRAPAPTARRSTDIAVDAIAARRPAAGQAGRDGAGGRHRGRTRPPRSTKSALTGEPLPVTRAAGEAVRSGVVNAGGAVRLRADRRGGGQHLRRHRAPGARRRGASARRWRGWRTAGRWLFLPVTARRRRLRLVACRATAERALAVLVVATPCPLILAAPVALVCGISRAARSGASIIKGGGALERLARVRTALFDKTGTLTSGTPARRRRRADARLRRRRGAAARRVARPGVAARGGARRRGGRAAAGLALSLPQGVDEIPGGGVAGTVDGRRGAGGQRRPAGGARAATLPRTGAATRLAGRGVGRGLGRGGRAGGRRAAAGRPHPAGGAAGLRGAARGRRRRGWSW